jgi:hypothetical protein
VSGTRETFGAEKSVKGAWWVGGGVVSTTPLLDFEDTKSLSLFVVNCICPTINTQWL